MSVSLDVGVDMDGVVYDFVGALRRHLHDTTGRPLNSMPAPSTWEFYTDDWGMSLDEFLATYEDAVTRGDMFAGGLPLPGAVEQVNRISAAGHRVHFVTDRASFSQPGVAEARTRNWLTEHGFVYDTLTVTGDKTSVPTHTFIEDRPENYVALRNAGVDAWLLDYPYNRHVDVSPGRRVHALAQFVDALVESAP